MQVSDLRLMNEISALSCIICAKQFEKIFFHVIDLVFSKLQQICSNIYLPLEKHTARTQYIASFHHPQ